MTQQQSKPNKLMNKQRPESFAKWRKEETLYKEDEKNATKEEK